METVWDTGKKAIRWERLVRDRFAEKDRKKKESADSAGLRWILRWRLIEKTGKEFHWPKMNYLGPGTQLQKRLRRGDQGVNRLDGLAKIHDIDYSKAKNLQDKWKADDKMIRAISKLPGKKTMQERIVKNIMQTKRKLKL